MRVPLKLLALAVLVAAGCGRPAYHPYRETEGPPREGDLPPADPLPTDLSKLLEPIQKSGVPGLAAVVLQGTEVVATGASGARKLGDATAVTVQDKWHLGTNTQAMTATLAAILVEQKKIAWSTSVESLFPELGLSVSVPYRLATLEQFLAHHGGAPAAVPDDIWYEMWQPGDARIKRQEAVASMLQREPANQPGSAALYSNAGYLIAGAMLERATGVTFETLLREQLFVPLAMASCGFGAPASDEVLDAPWGHKLQNEVLTAIAPRPGGDNPAAYGPAGTVHCTLEDWGRFVALHLRAGRGESLLLSAAGFQKLHTAVGQGEYALGWASLSPGWTGGPALAHKGSNSMFASVVWVAPIKNLAYLAVANRGDKQGADTLDRVIGALAPLAAP